MSLVLLYNQINQNLNVVYKILIIIVIIAFRFQDFLNISPHIFPINCLRAVSPEITQLKEHLCEVRGNLIQVSRISGM